MTYWEFGFHLKHTVVCSAVGALPKTQEDSLTWRNEPVKKEQEGVGLSHWEKIALRSEPLNLTHSISGERITDEWVLNCEIIKNF